MSDRTRTEPRYREVIHVVPEPVLKSVLSKHIVYQYPTPQGAWRDGSVPGDVVKDYLKRLDRQLPVLEGITPVPILHDDGTVHADPGYDDLSGYFLTDACRFDVPDQPTWKTAREALDELRFELFSDFPFAEPHHGSAALAALLQRAIQPSFYPLYNELVPGYLVRSPTRGSGKGLLVKAICIVVGELPFLTTPPGEAAEWRKLLMTIALEGHPAVMWDNIPSGTSFGSSVLDAVMTAGMVSDRILRISKSGSVPMNCTHFVTGNNIGVKGDAARRFLPIDLNAEVERPDLRQGWRHGNLITWARENRAKLITLVFTILRAHALVGRPALPPTDAYHDLRQRSDEGWEPLEERPPRLGSFERWDDLVRAPLLWLGEPDPCAGMQDIIDTADEDTQHLAQLLEALHGVFSTREFSSKDAYASAEQGKEETPTPDPSNPSRSKMAPKSALYHALRGDDPRPLTVQRVGKRIRAITDGMKAGMVLRRFQDRQNKALWRIQMLDQTTEGGPIPF